MVHTFPLVFLTAGVLLVGLLMLTTSRLEYWAEPIRCSRRLRGQWVADGPAPTLSPAESGFRPG